MANVILRMMFETAESVSFVEPVSSEVCSLPFCARQHRCSENQGTRNAWHSAHGFDLSQGCLAILCQIKSCVEPAKINNAPFPHTRACDCTTVLRGPQSSASSCKNITRERDSRRSPATAETGRPDRPATRTITWN